MPAVFTNNATSTLASAITSGSTSISIAAGDVGLFPTLSGSDWFPVTVIDSSNNMEIMRCTARSGATLTVSRAQEGTTARAFSAGARVDVRQTAASLKETSDNIAAKSDRLSSTTIGRLARFTDAAGAIGQSQASEANDGTWTTAGPIVINKALIGNNAGTLLQVASASYFRHGLYGDGAFRLERSPDGSSWIQVFRCDRDGTFTTNGILQLRRQIFTNSGTFTTPANITTSTVFKLTITGAGGGGMGGQTGNVMGAGGAAGSTIVVYITGLQPSTSYTVVVGAGGTAGTAGGGAGGNGGASSFVGVLTHSAPGGFGGSAGSGGRGTGTGAANYDDLFIGGDGGDSAVASSSWISAGFGGASFYGGGAKGGNGVAANAGQAGQPPGAGGSGGAATSSTQLAGGAGAPGRVVVEWVS